MTSSGSFNSFVQDVDCAVVSGEKIENRYEARRNRSVPLDPGDPETSPGSSRP